MASTDDAAQRPQPRIEPEISDAILTVPNVLTTLRILLIPVFLWLLLIRWDLVAGLFLATIAATDWVDGRLARRHGQVTKLGTMLDPAADRLLILAAAAGIIVRGDIMPLWLVLILVTREVLTAVWVLALKARGIQLVVRYVGKVQAALVFACIPTFIWASGFLHPPSGTPGEAAELTGHVLRVLGYVFALGGATLGYTTFGLYVHDGIRALSARGTAETEGVA